MLLTEQSAKTKWCWQPRNADMKCKASGCAMWRFWPEPDFPHGELRPRTADDSYKKEVGYCGLAGVPLTVFDIYPSMQAVAAQAELGKKRPK